MGTELGILALYGLVVMVSVFAQILAAQAQVGLMTLIGNREGMGELPGFAGRMQRMQANSIQALALFATAVLILAAKTGFTSATLTAAQIFLVARVIYAVVYAAGLPWIRTLSWVVAFLCTAYLLVAAL
jgi:uncharacterized MAPEG superfamily protein